MKIERVLLQALSFFSRVIYIAYNEMKINRKKRKKKKRKKKEKKERVLLQALSLFLARLTYHIMKCKLFKKRRDLKMNKYDEMYMSNPVGFGWMVVMVVSAVTAYQVSGNETVAAITWGVCTLGYLFYWLKLKEVWGF